MKHEIEKAFEDKFYCPAKFAQEIEQMVQMHQDMNYIDAIVSFCEINSIDLQSVPKLTVSYTHLTLPTIYSV